MSSASLGFETWTSRTFMAAAASSRGSTCLAQNRAARGLAYSSAPKTMYAFANGFVGFGGVHLCLVILGLLGTPQGPTGRFERWLWIEWVGRFGGCSPGHR